MLIQWMTKLFPTNMPTMVNVSVVQTYPKRSSLLICSATRPRLDMEDSISIRERRKSDLETVLGSLPDRAGNIACAQEETPWETSEERRQWRQLLRNDYPPQTYHPAPLAGAPKTIKEQILFAQIRTSSRTALTRASFSRGLSMIGDCCESEMLGHVAERSQMKVQSLSIHVVTRQPTALCMNCRYLALLAESRAQATIMDLARN